MIADWPSFLLGLCFGIAFSVGAFVAAGVMLATGRRRAAPQEDESRRELIDRFQAVRNRPPTQPAGFPHPRCAFDLDADGRVKTTDPHYRKGE